MKLELDRVDLMPEHAERNCSAIHFEHFKPEVQAAIVAAGRATFYEFGRGNYNAIYPLKDAPAPDAALLDAAKDAYGSIMMFVTGEWDGKQFGGWEKTLETLRAAIAQAETTK